MITLPDLAMPNQDPRTVPALTITLGLGAFADVACLSLW